MFFEILKKYIFSVQILYLSLLSKKITINSVKYILNDKCVEKILINSSLSSTNNLILFASKTNKEPIYVKLICIAIHV